MGNFEGTPCLVVSDSLLCSKWRDIGTEISSPLVLVPMTNDTTLSDGASQCCSGSVNVSMIR